MEFYKLFCLVHHRTDWPRMYEFERRCMMPEIYAQKEQNIKKAIGFLSMTSAMIGNMLPEFGYMHEYKIPKQQRSYADAKRWYE